MILEEFAMDFDLSRIRNLTVQDKFMLVNYIKLIYTESMKASQHGIKSLEKSENYSVNKTYNLFALLLVDDVPYELIKEIVRNYALHFGKSDIYYSHIAIFGMGIMMIQKEFGPDSILNFMMHLLGEDFLTVNMKYPGYMTSVEATQFEVTSQIEYKPFEGNLRRVKYDLLALLRIRDTHGLDAVSKIINHSFGDHMLKVVFNLMNVTVPEVRDYIYEDLKDSPLTEDQLKAYGVYTLLNELDVFSTHYMFNSIIGKYSRFDKDSSEIEQELGLRMDDILTKAGLK